MLNEGMLDKFITTIFSGLMKGKARKVYKTIQKDPELLKRTKEFEKAMDDYKAFLASHPHLKDKDVLGV